jgi:NADPH-dependent curcumin reductase CurA
MIKGFIVSDHSDRAQAFFQECAPLVSDGRLKYREDIVDGLEAAPAALIGMFDGRNFGKMLVRVSPDPTRP